MSTNGSINIINGFYVGKNVPIDYRMVALDVTERNAIVHKYDGLRVFLTSTRETYIWNEGLSQWEADATGTITGGGSASYVPRWDGNQSLENSDLYNTGNKIGLNTTTPLGQVHIKNPSYGDFSGFLFNTNSSDSFLGRNVYLNGSNLNGIELGYGSSMIDFNTTNNKSNITFKIRKAGSALNAFQDQLILGYKDSNNRYVNILKSLDGGVNHIVGSMSVSKYTDPNGENSIGNKDLLFVNGSFRTNGKVVKQTTTLDYYYNSGYLMDVSNLNNNTSNYNVSQTLSVLPPYLDAPAGTYNMTNEHELIVNNTTSPINKLVITLPSSPVVGQEVVIDYIKGVTSSQISSPVDLKNLVGDLIPDFNLNAGERSKLIYRGGSSPCWQIVELVSNNQDIKDDITTLNSAIQVIKNNGTYGTSPQSTYNINRTVLNGTEVTVEATIIGKEYGVDETSDLVKDLELIPQNFMGKKFFKVRHLLVTLVSQDSPWYTDKTFYLSFNHLINNGSPMIFQTGLAVAGDYMWIDDTVKDYVPGISSGGGFIDSPSPYVLGEELYINGSTEILPVISSYPIKFGLRGAYSPNPAAGANVTIKVVMSGYLV